MTDIAQITSMEKAVATRDLQRQTLAQVVSLSDDCAAEEQRIDEQHDEAIRSENVAFETKTRAAGERRAQRDAEFSASSKQREEAIRARHTEQRTALENANRAAQAQVLHQKREVEARVKKQVDEACWWSENVYTSIQAGVDTEEQKAKQDQESAQAELKIVASLEEEAQKAMASYGIEITASDVRIDSTLKQRIATESQTVLAEYRKRSEAQLLELQVATRVHKLAWIIPTVLIAAAAAGAAVGGWKFASDADKRLQYAGYAGLGAIAVCVMIYAFIRFQKRKRVEAKAGAVYDSLMESSAIARHAARVDTSAAAVAREKHLKQARRQRDTEVAAARDKNAALLAQAEEKYRAAHAAESQRFKEKVAVVDQEKDRGLVEWKQYHETTAREIEQEDSQTRAAAQSHHTHAVESIETQYKADCAALEARWAGGLRAVTDLISSAGGMDPQWADWNNPVWQQWHAPKQFSGQIRFGDMKVDLTEITTHVPKRLKLPETFTLPAMLALPGHASLLIESDHAGRAAAIEATQMVMARLMTQMPAGGVKFTLFDPVGLGQSFAGFMHLTDHDESLVNSRIWTEREHIDQRLADLTEHMETVIQKYLRNEYATIDEYNAQAGELAEPIRFLIIADFPTGLEAESLRRLASIATSGPRCGVYTVIVRDTRQPLPTGARMEEIIAASVRLQYKNGEFRWDDSVFKRFPLHLDPPPSDEVLTRLTDIVGKAAKEAKRVEVPFASIAPRPDQFWTMSSKNLITVPIGKTGATRLQSMRLGVGVAQHALVAGKTGSGKSNLMHTIVTNMAMWYSPDEVEFYLVDFKKGVEFKTYASKQLPHARAIAVESDREFGLSVLQRVDAELSRRGVMFREAGAQEITAFRDKTGQKLPRTILLIDEFQEFFSEDDKVGQESAGLLDRLVRQGRAFGIHVVLGSQTIGGTSGLARSTLGQVAVRVALQCGEADSTIILGDNNSAARLLTRPGEAIYNDAGGLIDANSPFQIAFLPDNQREEYLQRVRDLSLTKPAPAHTPIVFEGNAPAAIRGNQRLLSLLERPDYAPASSTIHAYIGEPVAIKDPSAIPIRRQLGANVLMIGQQEESATAIVASMMTSIAAQQKPSDAIFYLLDGTPADSRYFGLLERVASKFPHKTNVIALRQVPEAINEIAAILKERQTSEAPGPSIYLLLFGLQRYRLLRHQEDDFSFNRGGDEPAAPKPEKQFTELLAEGPAFGIHTIMWADTPITLERTLERATMRQFDNRVLFQMSASDSSNLIDSPLANRLGTHRALLYSEEQGTMEKCRPYQIPDEAWLKFIADHLKNRP